MNSLQAGPGSTYKITSTGRLFRPEGSLLLQLRAGSTTKQTTCWWGTTRGGILMSLGNFPESLSQQILAGIIFVGGLGVSARSAAAD